MLEYKIKSLSDHNLFSIFLNAYNKNYSVSSAKDGYLFKVYCPRFSQDVAMINNFYAALMSR